MSITTPTEAYCVLTDVGNFLPHRTYSSTSKPTTSQAEAIVKDCARVIDGYLRAGGYTTPLTDSDDVQTLKLINAMMAAALIEGATMAGTQGDSPVIATLSSAYAAHMEDLAKGRIKFKGAGNAPAGDGESPSVNYETGDEPDPVFCNTEDDRRGQF